MRKILFTPKWLALTLIVLIAIPSFKSLSDWQWRRLDGRLTFNSAVTTAMAKPIVPYTDLVANGLAANEPDEWRTVKATGVFLPTQQYLLRKRSLDSEAGLWVVTPFQLNSGELINVVRGWTPAGKSASVNPELSPVTTNQLEITGLLRIFQLASSPEPSDLPVGQRIGFDPQFGTAYIQLVKSDPDLTNLEITTLPAPKLTEGTHRSYAIQWLIFIVMLIVGYIILLRNDLINRDKLPII
jgi:cytochrome oxidase assembly protein ShyY1